MEEPYAGEDRILVHSPKCRSYAEKPEMSAYDVTEKVVEQIQKNHYGAIVLNFANPDLVGHSGNIQATIEAIETVDACVGKVVKTALENDYKVILTADHGNAEEMINLQTGEIDKEHSTNPVPLIIVSKNLMGQAGPSGDPPEGDLSLLRPVGVLSDVAPTILKLLGVEQPKEMTGRALV